MKLILSYCSTDLSRPTQCPFPHCNEIKRAESDVFLTVKLNLVSGMVIGAAAVMIMKQMCKRSREHQQTPAPVFSSQKQSNG